MKLASVTFVRFDGDVLEEFLRHTLRFVDRAVVCDYSADAAPAVLTSLRDEGLPIDVVAAASPYDTPKVDDLVRSAFEDGADFVLPLDADEFLRAPSRAALEEDLAALPYASAGLLPWAHYVPVRSDDPAEPHVLARIRHRLAAEQRTYEKVAVGRAFYDDADLELATGCHRVESAASPVEHVMLQQVSIGHFPVRSMAQIQGKAFLGWCTLEAYGERNEEVAYQWRSLFRRLVETGGVWDDDDLFDIGAKYLDQDATEVPALVLDPISPVERRYDARVPGVWELAADHIRFLSEENIELRTAAGLPPRS